MYLNIETTTKGQNKTYNVYINNGEEANYLNEEFSNKALRVLAFAIKDVEDDNHINLLC